MGRRFLKEEEKKYHSDFILGGLRKTSVIFISGFCLFFSRSVSGHYAKKI